MPSGGTSGSLSRVAPGEWSRAFFSVSFTVPPVPSGVSSRTPLASTGETSMLGRLRNATLSDTSGLLAYYTVLSGHGTSFTMRIV